MSNFVKFFGQSVLGEINVGNFQKFVPPPYKNAKYGSKNVKVASLKKILTTHWKALYKKVMEFCNEVHKV